jgi:outer membrane protein with beta-barrel domain
VRRRAILITAAAALFIAHAAVAQTVPAAQPKMPAWDANLSVGLISNSAKDEGRDYDSTSVHGEVRVDVGHYWTQHLKTEAGISFLNRWDDYASESFPVAGLPGGGYSIIQKSIRMTVLTPALTYQFLENQFAHPYVSVGARVGFLKTHSTRYPQTYTQNRITYSVPPLDRTDSTIVVRPMLAAGFKSYFNERTFLRTEGMASFGADGNPHPAFRVGFGFDF